MFVFLFTFYVAFQRKCVCGLSTFTFITGILKEKIPKSNGIPNIQIFCPVRRLHPKATETSTRNVSRQTNKTRLSSFIAEEELDSSHELLTSDEICSWLDFNTVFAHLVRMETLYIPASFLYEHVFHSVEELKEALSAMDREGYTEENYDEGEEPLVFHDAVVPVVREHFFLFMDNLQPSKLFFVVEKCDEYSAKSSRLVLEHRTEKSLIVEPWCWRDIAISERRVHISCVGSVSTSVFEIAVPPGINVFKLWYVGGRHIHFGIFGTDAFEAVPRWRLNVLLGRVSQHLSKLSTDIQTRLRNLLTAVVGTPEHGHAYNEFIETFCPRKYFKAETNINDRVQIKVEVLQKFETLLMENIVAYDYGTQASNIYLPLHSATSFTSINENMIWQVVLQCQEIFQDPAFGEKYLKENMFDCYQHIISFKRSLTSQSKIKLSKPLKNRKPSVHKKKPSKTVQMSSTDPSSSTKSLLMKSLLADIMEKNMNEFYTQLATTTGSNEEDVLLNDIRHVVHCHEISGMNGFHLCAFCMTTEYQPN